MELLSFLNNASIEGIPLLELNEKLNRINNTNQSCIVIGYNDRMKSIKCIREYYLDPITKKKAPKVNMVNPCPAIHGIFGVNNCASADCKNCHKKMIETYFSHEAFLIKSSKK